MCIGNNFALTEAQLMLAAIRQHYRLELVPGHRVELQPLVTLRPRHGMLMTARRVDSRRPMAVHTAGTPAVDSRS